MFFFFSSRIYFFISFALYIYNIIQKLYKIYSTRVRITLSALVWSSDDTFGIYTQIISNNHHRRCRRQLHGGGSGVREPRGGDDDDVLPRRRCRRSDRCRCCCERGLWSRRGDRRGTWPYERCRPVPLSCTRRSRVYLRKICFFTIFWSFCDSYSEKSLWRQIQSNVIMIWFYDEKSSV